MSRELIDVLAPDGTPTGAVKDKRSIHRDGEWHRAAHIWIAPGGGRVLLQRRALVKDSWPGLWDISVAGHVSSGETSAAAAVREAFEELGLRVDPAELRFLATLRYQCVLAADYVENEFHDVYLLRRDVDLSSLALDPQEVAEVTYAALHDLPRYERVPHPEEYALLERVLR